MTRSTMGELYALERLSGGSTLIHKRHPAAKLFGTLIFIITIVSFDRYAFGRLVPFVFYPALMMALSETPYAMLFKRFLIALPFCLFAGIGNLLFDRDSAFALGPLTLSFGFVSLCTILFRAYLCVMAVLLLVSVTPLAELGGTLRYLKVPFIFVTILEMTYRYLGVLFEEAYGMYTAYSLRSVKAKGIAFQDMGSFVGQLLLRSADRAERVYKAMLCRGYALRGAPHGIRKWTTGDSIFLATVCGWCVLFRLLDPGALWGGLG